MSCGGETLAKELLTDILLGKEITFPDIDLSGPEFDLPDLPAVALPDPLTNEDLTTRQINGTGTFDALMESIANHLKGEFQANRISGAEYTKAYIAAFQGALGTAAQYLLGKDQAYWQGVLAQAQAQTAQVELVTAKVNLQVAKLQAIAMEYQARNSEATYALTVMKLATEDQTFCQMKAQTELTQEQKKLVVEQMEAARAQTMNTRSDGVTTITGSIGKQKDLYTQQITSYQRDAEVKAGKLFVDAWITQKTIDEGLVAPTGFTNASVDQVLTKIKTENDFN